MRFSQLSLHTGIMVLSLIGFSHGDLVDAQAPPRRVTNAAAGISIIPPAGWKQLWPRPGDESTGSAKPSATERQAFLERTADTPPTLLFLFAKDLNAEDPLQTPSIVIRVVRIAPPGHRSVVDMIAASGSTA